ncbi:MAG: winged-helix domain-containing protein, partial [bacterium]
MQAVFGKPLPLSKTIRLQALIFEDCAAYRHQVISFSLDRRQDDRGLFLAFTPFLCIVFARISIKVPALMAHIDEKIKMAILRSLRDAESAVGSAQLAEELQAFGFNPSARTIRMYLTEMENEGLVEHARRGRNGGRSITPRGQAEIEDSLISDRVGFTAARVDTLSWEMSFDLAARTGRVVLNLTIVPANQLRRSVREMVPVLAGGLGMGEYVALFPSGTR